MQNTLLTLSPPGAQATVNLIYATITGRADQWFFLSTAEATIERAIRADSCLIEPDCGDTVLICNGSTMGVAANTYILAVLARTTQQQATLVLPGHVSMRTDTGHLHIAAEKLELNARQHINMQAPDIALHGIRGDIRFQLLTTTAQQMRAHFDSVHAMAKNITSTVGRLLQKVRDSFRWTENLDETRAGRMRVQIEERFHLTSQHATMLAKGQVKIDGEKIDLG